MRPTPIAVALFGTGVLLSVLLILLDEALWPLTLAYLGFALFVLGADAILAPRPGLLAVAVDPPPLLYIGDRGALGLRFLLPATRSGVALEGLCDVGALLEPPAPARWELRGGEELEVSLPLVPRRRGKAEVHRLWLRWRGPFGLMARWKVLPIAAEIPVVPNTRLVREAALRFASRDALFGLKAQSQQGEGTEFEALRDYVPGLDHRSIDWKHSARHRSLVCKEFRVERNHQILLAFDTGQLMSEPLGGIPRLDHAVNAGLLLAHTSLRVGDRVGVFGFDSAVRLTVDPVGGSQNFWRVQRASAELAYRHEETNFTLGLANLLGRLKRRSLVILMTEFVDTVTAELMVENLERLAARHMVVFLTLQDPDLLEALERPPRDLSDMARSAIADDFNRDRQVVFERLRRFGVSCLDVPKEQIGSALVNRYLQIKRKELI